MTTGVRQTLSTLLILSAAALPADELGKQRVWESSDGREMTAAVLQLDPDAGEAKMKRSDGFVFTIGFDRFSEADARKLREAAGKNPGRKSATLENGPPEPELLPHKLELDDVPMVRQKGSYCVPASAAMIAGYHGVETDQDQIAFLSSAQSFGNQGTSPRDMLLAMQKLGFEGHPLYWSEAEDFQTEVLPEIRKALFEQGPIYVSFKPGVFGDSGHGCIIIGYHDRKEELIFHNPWGNIFEKEYKEVARQARGLVLIEAPAAAPIASEAFIEKIRSLVPRFDTQFIELLHILRRSGQKHRLVWCSRRDARGDKRFATDTARDDGRKILDLAFHRNAAVLLPGNRGGRTTKYFFVTRPPAGGASFLAREITEDGWSDPELVTLGSLTRHWPTRIKSSDSQKIIWELPMIELHPGD